MDFFAFATMNARQQFSGAKAVTETIQQRIARLEELTNDAYSYDAYGASGWRGAIRMLIRHHLTDQQIEAVLRSKWTRWAGDAASNRGKRYGSFTGVDLEHFMVTAQRCGFADIDRELQP